MARSRQRQLAEMALREIVGSNLMLAREALGVARVEWQRDYQLCASKLWQWEHGKYMPDLLFLLDLCDRYGLTMDWFLRRPQVVVPPSVAAVRVAASEETPVAVAA